MSSDDVFNEVYEWVATAQRRFMRNFTITTTTAKWIELMVNVFELIFISITFIGELIFLSKITLKELCDDNEYKRYSKLIYRQSAFLTICGFYLIKIFYQVSGFWKNWSDDSIRPFLKKKQDTRIYFGVIILAFGIVGCVINNSTIRSLLFFHALSGGIGAVVLLIFAGLYSRAKINTPDVETPLQEI